MCYKHLLSSPDLRQIFTPSWFPEDSPRKLRLSPRTPSLRPFECSDDAPRSGALVPPSAPGPHARKLRVAHRQLSPRPRGTPGRTGVSVNYMGHKSVSRSEWGARGLKVGQRGDAWGVFPRGARVVRVVRLCVLGFSGIGSLPKFGAVLRRTNLPTSSYPPQWVLPPPLAETGALCTEEPGAGW